MTNAGVLTVVSAEQFPLGVYIAFADGANALYPTAFLRAHLPWFQLDPVSDMFELAPGTQKTL